MTYPNQDDEVRKLDNQLGAARDIILEDSRHKWELIREIESLRTRLASAQREAALFHANSDAYIGAMKENGELKDVLRETEGYARWALGLVGSDDRHNAIQKIVDDLTSELAKSDIFYAYMAGTIPMPDDPLIDGIVSPSGREDGTG